MNARRSFLLSWSQRPKATRKTAVPTSAVRLAAGSPRVKGYHADALGPVYLSKTSIV